jgi:hypothetical protein
MSTTASASASFLNDNNEFTRIGREFGFGVQRLTSHQMKDTVREVEVAEAETSSHFTVSGVSSDPSCANVSTNYFPGAVIDNFASISMQQGWTGKGQRYWLNDNLWGGPGYPIFVYIGGE